MANIDSSLEAGQALVSDRIENRRQLQDVTVSDGVDGVSNATVDAKKSRVALFTGLETLMGSVEQGANASNGSASDTRKGKGLGSAPPPASKDADGKDAKKKSGDKAPAIMPVGMAVLAASQKFQESSNQIIKNLADMSSEIMEATTTATKSGTDWLKNYYDYGLSTSESNSSEGIGQWKKGEAVKGGDGEAQIKITSGLYYMSVDGGKTFKELGAVQKDNWGYVIQPLSSQVEAAFPGYELDDDSSSHKDTDNADIWGHSGFGSQGDGKPFSLWMKSPDTNTGGTGINNGSSNDMQDKLKQYSYIQSMNNQRNTAMQAVSSLPSALEKVIVGSVDKAHSADTSTLSMQNSVLQMLKGWAN